MEVLESACTIDKNITVVIVEVRRLVYISELNDNALIAMAILYANIKYNAIHVLNVKVVRSVYTKNRGIDA